MKILDKIDSAERVALPSGRDLAPCRDAIGELIGIELPDFPERVLCVESQGVKFYKLKGKDIPQTVASGLVDVGFAGTDVCQETDVKIGYEPFGDVMCSYELLVRRELSKELTEKLALNNSVTEVVTSLPRLLTKCAGRLALNIVPSRFVPTGSLESMIELGAGTVVADIVQTGRTAEANGLSSILSLDCVRPAAVFAPAESTIEDSNARYLFSDIEQIDKTLENRYGMRYDIDVRSYTLSLMKDQNLAGKKFGEEASEVMMAIMGLETSEKECTDEIADLLYSSLVLAYSNNKQVRLGSVLRTLVKRNRGAKLYEKSRVSTINQCKYNTKGVNKYA